MAEKSLYGFSDCILDPARRELRRGNEIVAVEPQVFDILLFLVENRARVVTKDDLYASVWGGRIVSESALASRLNAVRSAIGDNGQDQRLIRTFPRKGFRFVGDVREERPSPNLLASTALQHEAIPVATELAVPSLEPQGREAPATVALTGEVFAVSNIPIRIPEHFLGREDSLAAIETALGRDEGRVAITALHGLRGVGKTTLAAAYAERHRGDYRATWWIRAQTEATMRTDLVGLGVRLRWVPADEKEEPALAAVMERLRHEGHGILLIYDNAIDAASLEPCLPRGGTARVLVTSNAHAWRGIAAPVEIRLWPKEIGAEYLVARTDRQAERAAAAALSQTLGGLPLAHEQAAAYCERLDVPLAEYGRRFTAAPGRLLDDARHAPAEYHDGLTVAKTFALAIEEAAKLHPASEPLLVHAALLAAEPVPLFLFAEAREAFGEPIASALADDGLDEAVAALRAFALVDREAIVDGREASIATDTIRLHRLVREVAAARCEGDAQDRARRALVAAMMLVYPEDGYDNPASWPRCASLTPHLMVCCEAAVGDSAREEERADLLNRAGEYFYACAAFAEARSLLERALAIREKVLGPEHPATAESLNNLAFLLQNLGNFAESRPLNERALAIYEKVLGPEHHQTATGLRSLARCLQAHGDLAGARRLYERALAIHEKVLGPEHQQTAATLNRLAMLLLAQRDLAAARPLHERALTIREKVFGPEHPFTAESLNNLAWLLQAQGDLTGAQSLYERAVAAWDKGLGAKHPGTNRARRNLAHLLLVLDRPDEALKLGEDALAAHEGAYGREHPWTKDSARVTADALDALGHGEEAKALRARYGIETRAK